jgi:DNA-binding Xre family transcriptional regulator
MSLTGLSNSTAAKLSLRNPQPVNLDVINTLCKTFKCQPCDLISYEEEAGCTEPVGRVKKPKESKPE